MCIATVDPGRGGRGREHEIEMETFQNVLRWMTSKTKSRAQARAPPPLEHSVEPQSNEGIASFEKGPHTLAGSAACASPLRERVGSQQPVALTLLHSSCS
jgi:hypothetical protein